MSGTVLFSVVYYCICTLSIVKSVHFRYTDILYAKLTKVRVLLIAINAGKLTHSVKPEDHKQKLQFKRRCGAVSRLTRNVEVVGSSPIKGPRCFLEQETSPLLLSTGWFLERIRA